MKRPGRGLRAERLGAARLPALHELLTKSQAGLTNVIEAVIKLRAVVQKTHKGVSPAPSAALHSIYLSSAGCTPASQLHDAQMLLHAWP